MNKDEIIIIDDFYTSPDKVRNLALNTQYQNFGSMQNFPGYESIKSYYSDPIINRFEKIIGKEIKVSPEKNIFGKFRYSLKKNDAATEVHLDYDVEWTGIVYLSEDSDSKGGLGIYRHKKLDLSKAPTVDLLVQLDCENLIEFDTKYVYPYTKSKDMWELTMEIEAKYNRLILFKGSKYFHGITEQFGDSIENSRLTQNFFFQEAR